MAAYGEPPEASPPHVRPYGLKQMPGDAGNSGASAFYFYFKYTLLVCKPMAAYDNPPETGRIQGTGQLIDPPCGR